MTTPIILKTPKGDVELGPYKVTVDWSPLVDEETKQKAMEEISIIAKHVDDSADFELECVQKITFERD